MGAATAGVIDPASSDVAPDQSIAPHPGCTVCEHRVLRFSSTIRIWATLQCSGRRVEYGWCCDACRWSGLRVATFGEAQRAVAAHRCGFVPSGDAAALF